MLQGEEKSFVRRVADAYRALGFQVIVTHLLDGRQVDLLAERQVAGALPVKLVIDCKELGRPAGATELSEFAAFVLAQRAAGAVTGGALISNSGFTAGARAAADATNVVALLTLEDLISEIIEARAPLTDLIDDYERQEIHRDYVPLKVSVSGWEPWAPSREEDSFDSLLPKLAKFNGKSGVGALLVLADFGVGKTTLLRRIEHDRAAAYLDRSDSRIPLFVRLRSFRESENLDALLRSSFQERYYQDLRPGLLWRLIEGGNFYLLLDGFDEMADRSDAEKRLELFHVLAPLLKSQSPAILTSRPSYMAERGELESLLAQIRSEEGAMPVAGGAGAEERVGADRLRRELFEQIGERRSRRAVDRSAMVPDIEVVRLLPLDQAQVREFVSRRLGLLREAGATPEDVLAFIERTYELSDLATRPILLQLIISTVLLGGVDLSNSRKLYGASGLYEVYTQAEIDLEAHRVPGRRSRLDSVQRLQLTEALALAMYRDKVSDVDLQGIIRELAAPDGPLGRALSASGLSAGEIASDLAARSFLTVDRDGMCRFIHKSFLGFFVARALKDRLQAHDPMFDVPLEREVLYFLGGFDPTDPSVGNALWSGYRRAPQGALNRRRNFLAGYLYTRPRHEERLIHDVVIFDVEFNLLQFVGTPMRQVEWRDSTIATLELSEVRWTDVKLIDTHLSDVVMEGGRVEMLLEGTLVGTWRCDQGAAALACVDSMIETWSLEGSRISCEIGSAFQVQQMELREASLSWEAGEASDSQLVGAEITDSYLRLDGEVAPERLRATGSVISYGSARELDGGWTLAESILGLAGGNGGQPSGIEKAETGLQIDQRSVILAPKGLSQSLLASPAGVFGGLARSGGAAEVRINPAAWGAVEGDAILKAIGLPAEEPGCRLGRLLLIRGENYGKLLADGLPAIIELRRLLDSGDDFIEADMASTLRPLLASAREQHEAILDRRWRSYADYAEVPKRGPSGGST